MTSKLIAGNWKLYKTRPDVCAFVQDLKTKLAILPQSNLPDVLICPTFTGLETALRETEGSLIQVGAQTMESRSEGAYTGEVSPEMLQELGLRWVILGHSERRQYYAESNATVAAKTTAALAHGLTPIICVGESLEQREADQTDTWVTEQVHAVLETGVSPTEMVFAYEPIWAIGTGKVCDAVEANRVCALIQTLAPQARVLYGGSVKPDNIVSLMSQPAIDGALVGGASLEVDSFLTLIKGAMGSASQPVGAH